MSQLAVAKHVLHCMGTVFSFDVRTPGFDATVFARIDDVLHDLDARFSTYRDDSEISRIDDGRLNEADASTDVQWVLRRCAELEIETDGYFSAHATGRLDPSGYVKGWAIETASHLLAAAGSTSHCVNGGGDAQCAGEAAPGEPWRVGIAHPLRQGELVGVVAGNDLAVATSGSAERGAHVIDPHTGRAPTALASITVVGRRIAEVDAYATAAFAMDDGAREWLETLVARGYRSFGVQADGATWSTGF